MKNPGTLQVTTPSEREIAMTRVFDAPRRPVFDALTKPELLKRWLLGPPGWSLPICEIDLKVGGAFRFVWRSADGREMRMRGTYREIVPPERIVWTFEFEGMPGNISVDTMTLTEEDGKTTITATSLYDTVEQRDGMLQSGMETGAAETYDRLAELLAKLQSA
jgi:uncharacterized protein YndB with AHSA1/START domain